MFTAIKTWDFFSKKKKHAREHLVVMFGNVTIETVDGDIVSVTSMQKEAN